ncbi:hypothetical protein CJF42_21010 [Pseudoalteromonas sp. NBT06-2]|nr:hypothetical protein CJF42_21010 [Pseudoalteromonas sp. NBT06-2]
MKQKIAQIAGVIVFILSVLNFVLGINLISINTVFSFLIGIYVCMLILHMIKDYFVMLIDNKEV